MAYYKATVIFGLFLCISVCAGGGIFVSSSKDINNKAVANNSVIIVRPNSCRNCRVDFHCYSNSSDNKNAYIIFPNNGRYYSNRRYNMEVSRIINPSGIQLRNYMDTTPSLEGIYTCQLRDSNDNILDFNIGYYTDDPQAPYTYDSKFTDLSNDCQESTAFGVIEIKTRYSPPTNVTWKRDGVTVYVHPHVGGDGYEMTQVLTSRRNSEYSSFLLIRNAAHLPGNHNYQFIVSNNEGTIITDLQTQVEVGYRVTITKMTEEAIHRQEYTLKCSASFVQCKLAPELMQYTSLEWLDDDEQVLFTNNNFTVGNLEISGQNITSTLTFTPMDFRYEGQNYTCRTKLQIPNEVAMYNKSKTCICPVIDRTILQLKIGPLSHCSQWYKDKKFTRYLQKAINETIRNVLKKSTSCNNDCKFYDPLLTNIEYSCQTYTSCVIFRATLTGDLDTLTVPQMIEGLQNWLTYKGTFLYKDHTNAPIQLRADPECSLEVCSFAHPECRAKECLFDCHPDKGGCSDGN